MTDLKTAARELVHIEVLSMNLRSKRSECIGAIKSIQTTRGPEYFLTGNNTSHLRINKAQWLIYDYINGLHAVWNFIKNTDGRMDTSNMSFFEIAPQLLALRNYMQHVGPIRMHYIPAGTELAVSIKRLKVQGNWDSTNHRSFEDYFGEQPDSDFILLRKTIQNSDELYKNLTQQLRKKHISEHGEHELREAAEDISMFNVQTSSCD